MASKKVEYLQRSLILVFTGLLAIIASLAWATMGQGNSEAWERTRAMVRSGQIPKQSFELIAKRKNLVGSGQNAKTQFDIVLRSPEGREHQEDVGLSMFESLKEGDTVEGYEISGSLYLADLYNFDAPARKPSHTIPYGLAGIGLVCLLFAAFSYQNYKAAHS